MTTPTGTPAPSTANQSGTWQYGPTGAVFVPSTAPTPAGTPRGNDTATAPATTSQVKLAAPVAPAISGATPAGSEPTGNQTEGPDASFYDSLKTLDPANAEANKDKIYSYYAGKSQADIDAIKATAAAAEFKANTQMSRDTSGAAADAARRGMTGTDTSVLGSKAVTDQEQAIADAESSKATSLAAVADNISKIVETTNTNDKTTAQNYVDTKMAQASNVVKALATQGSTLDDLKTSHPAEYNQLLQYYNNDPEALHSAFVLAQPAKNVVQSWMTGTTYNQLVTDPTTGKPSVQSVDLKTKIPTGWVSQKIGTTSVVMQDPNNPANTITYSTNPFTGATTIDGTGTGRDLLQQQGIELGSNPSASGDTGAGTASTTISSILGVDPTTSLSSVIQSNGLGSVVSAMIKNEGGSPAGVQNNQGNIKFVGQAGATDSGVKAPDGGTFASFATPEDGQRAIAEIVQNAADGKSTEYGTNPTLQDFVNKYTNTGTANTSVNQTTGLDTKEWGNLANVQGFDPSKAGVDADAGLYLKKYFSTGTFPTARDLGISTYGGKGQAFAAVQTRANELLQKLGITLPNATVLASNLDLVSKNNALLNNLKVQEGTIGKNFGLNLENLDKNKVNQSAPVINKLMDSLAKASGNVDVATYLAQNSTIQNELGSLLAVKNASGTTVADKLAGGDLLPSDLSADQQKAILTVLMKEAENAKKTVGQTNASLYEQTDPLGLDPNNPINAQGARQLSTQNFSNNYDGTWTDPSGTSGYTVKGNRLVSPDGSQQWDLSS